MDAQTKEEYSIAREYDDLRRARRENYRRRMANAVRDPAGPELQMASSIVDDQLRAEREATRAMNDLSKQGQGK